MNDIYGLFAARRHTTPQMEQARDDEVVNHAGGFVFGISHLARIKRFLILGSEGGTFYQKAGELTLENAKLVETMANSDNDEVAVSLVDLIVDVSVRGLAPKVQPALFALAIAANGKNAEGRKAAKYAVTKVVRTGSHLLTYIRYVDLLGGWSRGKRAGVNAFYEEHNADQLAYQFVKYFQREGWDQRDVLRVTHPKIEDQAKKDLFDWVTKKNTGEYLPRLVWDFLKASKIEPENEEEMIQLIAMSNLSWEMLPDWAVTRPGVWKMLLTTNRIPLTALIRNLSRLTELGIIDQFGGEWNDLIIGRLVDQEYILKSRVHPINILIAAVTYRKGKTRGGKVFDPSTHILAALDRAFHLAFGNVVPANKRTLIGLDVSGSMGSATDPSGILTAREAGAAMALVISATEPYTATYGFTGNGMWSRAENTSFTPLHITGRERLDDVIRATSNLSFGTTDCSMPMREALTHDWDVDTFIIITDNETWEGPEHPYQSLAKYRRSKESRKDAKLIVLSVTATDFSIADPHDPLGQLDICGFGSDVPQLVSAFSAGL